MTTPFARQNHVATMGAVRIARNWKGPLTMATWSRRDVLEQSMLSITAALAAGGSRKTWADDTPASASPSERLRVAVLGVNGQGNGHLRSYANRKDCEVAIICDPDKSVGERRVKDIEKLTGKAPRHVTDPRQVMDDKSIQVVSIATPNHWHALAAIWAMQSGKDVYVEKPVSHNVQEGRSLVEAARRYQRICQTGTQIRSSRGIQDAIAYLRSGELGKVQVARGLCYKQRNSIGKVNGDQPIPANIDYNVWSGPAPVLPLRRRRLHYDWHWIWDYGNGDLGNQGIHQMDLARWALGVDRLADEVIAFGGRLGYVDDGQTPNTEVAFFKYGDQRLIFETRGLPTDKFKGAGVGDVIHCSNGYLVISSYTNAAAFDPKGSLVKSFTGGGDHFGNFLKAVRSRRPQDLAAEIREGHLSSALCHLANISYRLGSSETLKATDELFDKDDVAKETVDRTKSHLAKAGVKLEEIQFMVGRRLTLDPKSETFPGQSDANALLTREYRAPFVVPEPTRV